MEHNRGTCPLTKTTLVQGSHFFETGHTWKEGIIQHSLQSQPNLLYFTQLWLKAILSLKYMNVIPTGKEKIFPVLSISKLANYYSFLKTSNA